jgi:hypothetical protein
MTGQAAAVANPKIKAHFCRLTGCVGSPSARSTGGKLRKAARKARYLLALFAAMLTS